MANLITYVNSILKPYYKYALLLILVIIFGIVSRYVYNKYYDKPKKIVSNVANANNMLPVVTVYLFHVDWCPHCINARPEWEKFKAEYNNKEVNGYLIQCIDIDCTDDNGEQVIQFDNGVSTGITPTPIRISEIIRRFKIESYPTIKMTKDDLIIDFDAKVTQDNLSQFVNSV
jgi:thiol-disulfide isomerase/thioredoxin